MNDTSELELLLKARTDQLNTEYDENISSLQQYDVSSFHCELNSGYNYYAEQYFDKEIFHKMARDSFGIDLSSDEISDKTMDIIRDYSKALITVKTLKQYIEDNDLVPEMEEHIEYCV